MLDGWYCRSMANMQVNDSNVNMPPEPPPQSLHPQHEFTSDSSSSEEEPEPNYKVQYQALKKKLKYLIYENECFMDKLRNNQKKLLKISRDRSFLLDRLLQYEKPDTTSSESEETESSDDMESGQIDSNKRKRNYGGVSHQHPNSQSALNKAANAAKRKRPAVSKKSQNANPPPANAVLAAKAIPAVGFGVSASDGHMTPEEVERHLQSRQSYLEMLPERAPPTVPTEMFSNDPSLDSESNDVLENSPNVEEWFD